jgi:hypothetical protein
VRHARLQQNTQNLSSKTMSAALGNITRAVDRNANIGSMGAEALTVSKVPHNISRLPEGEMMRSSDSVRFQRRRPHQDAEQRYRSTALGPDL